ncbi:MAG: Rpn family recombination-promoting nuclease/putative transposase [Chromatiales bacterium]|nr:Rpn family recombination-promoting nuclease/putative transposase [Chromatiales bacterium]
MPPHDAAYKLLFSFPEMVRDLLDGFVSGDWVAELDLSTLERWPASQVGDTLRERHQDRVWRVRYHRRWLYVLVLLEFQSTVDRTMAVRVLAYSALLYQDLLRTGAEPLPPVLPIVLHHGPGRWTAATEVAEFAAPSGAFLAPYQPAQRYFLLDFGEHDAGDYTDAPLPRGPNLVAALGRLERSRSDEDARAVLGALDAWLLESGNEALRRAVGEWIRQVYGQRRPAAAATLTEENRTEAQTMLRERVQEWMAEKWAEGHAEGQLDLMRRQAARKFGDEIAERLAERLEPVQDAARLAEIGEWLIECGSGEALLARLDRASDFVRDGQKPESRPPR